MLADGQLGLLSLNGCSSRHLNFALTRRCSEGELTLSAGMSVLGTYVELSGFFVGGI